MSKQLSTDEKLSIIETEYHIPIEDEIRKDVSVMCNLSQGIREDAKEEIIINMHNTGFKIEQIALATQKSEEEVKAIIETREPVLV